MQRGGGLKENIMKIRYLLLAAPTVLLLPQVACSSSSTPASGSSDCATNPITPTCKAISYANLDPTPVSFQNDILGPIIRPTCDSAGCHGTPLSNSSANFPVAGLYLGPASTSMVTPVDATLLATINSELMQSAKTAPSMKIVTPGDPANSFLMLKLTGCQNTKSLSCTVQSAMYSETKTGCGDAMPPSCFAQTYSLTLTDAEITTFARWIAQGAKNN
jgi:hypothetical protein